MKNLLKFPLIIQFFADEEGTDNSQSVTSEEGTAEMQENSQKSFTQEDVDKIVRQRLSRERTKWEKEQQEQQTEAEKLAGMNEKQKKEYQEKKRQDSLDAREKEITKRELMATAKETLADKGLPISLASVLDYTDADTCNSSIESVEKAFQEAVQKAVDDKLKGNGPITKAKNNTVDNMKDEVYKAMMGR